MAIDVTTAVKAKVRKNGNLNTNEQAGEQAVSRKPVDPQEKRVINPEALEQTKQFIAATDKILEGLNDLTHVGQDMADSSDEAGLFLSMVTLKILMETVPVFAKLNRAAKNGLAHAVEVAAK